MIIPQCHTQIEVWGLGGGGGGDVNPAKEKIEPRQEAADGVSSGFFPKIRTIFPNHSPAAPTALPLNFPEKFSGALIKGLHCKSN